MLVASESAVKNFNLKPLARIVSWAIAGVEPRIMGIGPVFASQKSIKKIRIVFKRHGYYRNQ